MALGSQRSASSQLILLGAGHAHLHLIRHAASFAKRDVALTVIAPDPFHYSGVATGILGGCYPPCLGNVEIASLLGPFGRFVADRVVGLDAATRTVRLARQAAVRYDLLSVDLGSETPILPGRTDVYAAKPIIELTRLRSDLEARFADPDHKPVRVAVAGGGTTAIEIAANLQGLAMRRGGKIAVTVLAAGPRISPNLPPAPLKRLSRSLKRRGIVVQVLAQVVRVEPGVAHLANGEEVPFDLFVNATGLVPSAVISRLGLPTDPSGALLIDRQLRSIADPRVFGGGDGVAVDGHPLAKAGVFAIRQGPVLLNNLLATLAGTELRSFWPQRRYLWIMNLGDGTGLAAWNGLTWQGRLAFLLKDRIDRRFLTGIRRR